MAQEMITLRSSDGEAFSVEKEIVLQSETLRSMLEDEVDADAGIPLTNISSKTLAKVIEYCKYHVNAKKGSTGDKAGATGEKGAGLTDDIKSWDDEFIKVDQASLFEIILVTFYHLVVVSLPLLTKNEGS